MKCSRNGSACRSRSSAASPPRSRRKHTMQVGRQAVAAGVGERRPEAAEHGLQRHPVAQMRLRIAEDLRPPHPGRGGTGQVRRREVVEVLLGPEHRQVGVVDVEERLQVAEVRVPRAQFGRVVGRQRHVVAAGQRHEQVGLERALDVQVEFGERRHAASQLRGQPPGPGARSPGRHGTWDDWIPRATTPWGGAVPDLDSVAVRACDPPTHLSAQVTLFGLHRPDQRMVLVHAFNPDPLARARRRRPF